MPTKSSSNYIYTPVLQHTFHLVLLIPSHLNSRLNSRPVSNDDDKYFVFLIYRTIEEELDFLYYYYSLCWGLSQGMDLFNLAQREKSVLTTE